MDRWTRRSGLLGLLAASWFARTAFAVPSPRPRPSPAASDRDLLAARLAEDAIRTNAHLPRVLYTWTTEEQVAALRIDRVLLVRTESPAYGQNAIARALAAPRFARHRYCWNQPWATASGCASETYGDRLLRIELRPAARMAVFSPEPRLGQTAPPNPSKVWRLFESDGAEITEQDFLSRPDRIGVVMHVAAAWAPGTFAQPIAIYNDRFAPDGTYEHGTTLSFREYVLVDPSMIAAFEVDTIAVREALQRSRQIAAALAHTHPLPPELDAVYRENLAFVCERYRPDAMPEVVRRLDAALARTETPLRHEYTPSLPRR
jgi:hypothetical protein